jgi:hypothetical protein
MLRKFFAGLSLFLTLAMLVGSSVKTKAGPLWWSTPYWYLDARVTLVPTPVRVTVPTGYWGGFSSYPWLGVVYPSFYGGIYTLPPGFNVPNTWYGGLRFRGFLDALTYRYTVLVPRTTYWWSWYWDPDMRGHNLEMVTLGDETTGSLLSLDSEVISGLSVDSHTLNVNGGNGSGAFGPLSLVSWTSESDFRNQIKALSGMPTDVLDTFMISDHITNLLANNPQGMVLIQNATFVPEPSTLALFGTGTLGLLGYAWRRRKMAA